MFNTLFDSVYRFVKKHRNIVLALFVLITVCAAARIHTIDFNNTIEVMLPDNAAITRNLTFLRESNLSDKVILSFKLLPSNHDVHDLVAVVDQLAENLDSPLISKVISGVPQGQGVRSVTELLEYMPQLISSDELEALKEKLTIDGVERSLKGLYKQLLTPVSMAATQFSRIDPFGIKLKMLKKFDQYFAQVGKNVTLVDGHFVNQEHTHAMMILETPVTITDGAGSRELLTYLHTAIDALPDFVAVDIIAGHNHSVSNEDIVRRDIYVALTVAMIGFLLIFGVFFRDIRLLSLLLVPFASVIIAVNVCSFILPSISLFILGMGGVIAGIAVDYGIHVYAALCSKHTTDDAVKIIAKPVTIGALTTIGVFATFFFSSVAGYAQLALFAIISIVICLCYSLFILPHSITPSIHISHLDHQKPCTSNRRIFSTGIVVAWIALLMIAELICVGRMQFSNDVMQYDGADASIFQAEEIFNAVWGIDGQPAVLVVEGKTVVEVYETTENILFDLQKQDLKKSISSVVGIIPSLKKRTANLQAWTSFWKGERAHETEALVTEKGHSYGFSPDAFDPFFRNLYPDEKTLDAFDGVALINELKKKFIRETDDGYQMVSFFPDEQDVINVVTRVSNAYPGSFIVSRKAFSSLLSTSISSEILFLSVLVGVLVPLLACILLRNVWLVLFSLAPVISAIAAVFVGVTLLGLSINVPIIVALLVVIGLSIDYGIFMVYQCHFKTDTKTRLAVTVSTLTTLIGAGALLFAKHPVMFSIGLTLELGVGAGYIVSMVVIPSLCHLCGKGK